MDKPSAGYRQRVIPLFPLHTVLFPGGRLPLRIFEPRYLDMISRCMKEESGFGICLINEGSEVGEVPTVYDVGTYGVISYFHQRPDGLLGITVTGERRFHILESEVLPNKSLMATVEFLDEIETTMMPARWDGLVERVRRILNELGHPYETMPKHFDDAGWVSARLSELLPLPLTVKQRLLSLDDPIERIALVQQILEATDDL